MATSTKKEGKLHANSKSWDSSYIFQELILQTICFEKINLFLFFELLFQQSMINPNRIEILLCKATNFDSF